MACPNEINYFSEIVALLSPVAPLQKGVLGYGSLRGDTLGILTPTATPLTFHVLIVP